MSAKNQSNKLIDGLKWLALIVIVVAAVWANDHYAAVSPALRLVGGIFIAIFALFIAFQTEKGRHGWKFLKEARDEIRRVVWPGRQTVLQISLVIAAMVVVAMAAIFIFDQIFTWLIAWLTGQRG